MEYLQATDEWLAINAWWLDVAALFVISAIALKVKRLVAFVVFCEFSMTVAGYSEVRSWAIWPDIDLDYQYVLGSKDALMALILFLLGAHPLLTLFYIVASLSCFTLLVSYELAYGYLVPYSAFEIMFYAWSPFYFVVMLAQIFSLSFGDSDAGKRFRRRIIPTNSSGVFKLSNSAAYRDFASVSRFAERHKR